METKCVIHPDREAVGACSSCGSYVCPECKVTLGEQVYCNSCVQWRLKTANWPNQTSIIDSCPSGQGPNTPVPAAILRWNWGAFFLTWIWGIGNNVWISLIALASIIPYVGWIVGLTMSIILGMRGNQWAWQHKRWDSIEHFQKTQRRWMMWGLAAFGASILMAISVAVLLVSIVMIVRTLGYGGDWTNMIPWDW